MKFNASGFLATFFCALVLGMGCVAPDENTELDETDDTLSTVDEQGPAGIVPPEPCAPGNQRAASVSNGHGTAYVWVNRYGNNCATHAAGLVDQCSGGRGTHWRILNSGGAILWSGWMGSCGGGGIGGSYGGTLTVQVQRNTLNGTTGAWYTAVSY